MQKKKNLKVSTDKFKRKEALNPSISIDSGNVRPLSANCHFSQISAKNYDLTPYYGRGFDDIVTCVYYTIQTLLGKKGGIRQTTINGYLNSGFTPLVDYLEIWSNALSRSITQDDISHELIDNYITHLKGTGIGYTSQKSYYTQTKALLKAMYTTGYWQGTSHQNVKDMFPKNPYPNSNRRTKGGKPFTEFEKRQLVVALKQEVKVIYRKTAPLNAFELMVCVLSIAMQTGINPSPLLNMTTSALSDHPLKKNRKLLTVFKYRGNATQLHSLRISSKVELAQGIKLDVAYLIERITELNESLRTETNTEMLLVFRTLKDRGTGSVSSFTYDVLANQIKALIKNHDLVDEDGKAISVNLSRIRKTFSNRIYELSGQNILVAAKSAKHDINTADNHYLEAPAEAKRNIGLLGEIRVKNLTYDIKPTALASCKDAKGGHKAPKDGTFCVDFLGCFRCKSFVVTGDDLYRIFSFYWAIVRNRDSLGRKNWKKHLRHILSVIDNNIAIQFPVPYIAAMKEKAKNTPHPYWKNLNMLRIGQ
jgi:hypothetical protein